MWLHVPGMVSAPAPAGEDWTSLLNSSSANDIALYVTSSERATPRPLSWRGWQRRPWMKLLCGTVLKPLEARRGVELWISSLAASRAHPSVSPAEAVATKTSAGFGRTSLESFAIYDPNLSGWKMSQASLLQMMDESAGKYSQAWPVSGISSHGMCFQLKPWVPPTLDVESLSSADWSTPKAVTGGANSQRLERNAGGPDLRLSLTGEAKDWTTPKARDWRDGRKNTVLTHSPDLNIEVEQYRSSRPVQDWLTLALSLQFANFNSQTLNALSDSIKQNSQTPLDGPASSRNRPRLNRLFVEWLMNWPLGWTSFDFAATEYTRWLQQSRSMFLVLVSE